eukprot:CAMPEP_0194485608 /NCGR_PEP_ID=MMETSP0253-20130528/6559_1 /TAXON_ID=2966 /ORGANISM="Noctiluca scintillans" /LENGTH=101 /DNA_ID=CAMNT_0039325607 /DNA_START=131 /DNA_END=433 /DNA_ORIENTATION=+
MPGSGLVVARRTERDLQRQVQKVSTSLAPHVALMSGDPPLVRSRLRDPANSVDMQSTASTRVSFQGTEQSFGTHAEGLEEGFTRRLALVEQDLNQKLGKLV